MDSLTTMLASMVRLTGPLAFSASGEYVAERGGTLNISLDGMMLAGSFFGIWGGAASHNVAIGLICGMFAGVVVAVIHANLSHRLQTNTFVVGLTLNVLAFGLTSYLLRVVKPKGVQARKIAIPLLHDIPVIGEPLFQNRWPIYLLIVVIPLAWFLVNRTRWGLELRACGEDPRAADVTGIDVNKRRRQGLYIAGLATGLAGAYLAVGEVGLFTQNMTAGRGYLVNAAIIFGGWRLGPALAGCVVFGGTDALRLALPAIGYNIQPQLLIVTPYVLAILAMCFFAKRNQHPRGLAQPFERGVA